MSWLAVLLGQFKDIVKGQEQHLAFRSMLWEVGQFSRANGKGVWRIKPQYI